VDLIDRINQSLENTMNAVKAAAERCDVVALQRLSHRGQRLQELKHRITQIAQEFSDLENGSHDRSFAGNPASEPPPSKTDLADWPPASTRAQPSSPTRLVIEVTQGMINQNLLTLTGHVKAGRVFPKTEMRIEAKPSGELFCTDLLPEGSRLRERGAIARFNRDAKVCAGDEVVLSKAAADRWTLEKLHNGHALPPPSNRHSDDQI